MSGLFNIAGGPLYHAKALIYRPYWREFQKAVENWLESWDIPKHQGLILVGPSAGYNLPMGLLSKFKTLVVLEVDPVARILFHQRLKSASRAHGKKVASVHFLKDDLLIESQGQKFAQLLSLYPNRPVLFCNILGQLSLLADFGLETDQDEKQTAFLKKMASNFEKACEGRPWASFHDRLSGPLRPDMAHATFAKAMSDAQLTQEMYPSTPGELTSHELPVFWPHHLTHHYWRWRLTGKQYHLIEAVRG